MGGNGWPAPPLLIVELRLPAAPRMMPGMIDLTVNPSGRDRAVRRARERGIVIPTFHQQIDPGLVPREVGRGLREVGLWDLNPLNLFRITWHNQPVARGGAFGGV